MDPRAAVGIINFTLGLRVEDSAPEDKLNLAQSPASPKAPSTSASKTPTTTPSPNYKLGRVTPWKAAVEGIEQPVPTVFVQPRDKNHKHQVYCLHRRHHHAVQGWSEIPARPPAVLFQSRHPAQDPHPLATGRPHPRPRGTPKPVAHRQTARSAHRSRRHEVAARRTVRTAGRESLRPRDGHPASRTTRAGKTGQIALVAFDSETETLLEIFPPESPDAHEVKATISDRPDTVFDLPLKPEPGLVSLANLPLSVNDLRDPTLTHLNIQSLRGIAIQPATGAGNRHLAQPPPPVDGRNRRRDAARPTRKTFTRCSRPSPPAAPSGSKATPPPTSRLGA